MKKEYVNPESEVILVAIEWGILGVYGGGGEDPELDD